METLFPSEVLQTDVPAIPGLRYMPAYVTENEEIELLRRIEASPWDYRWERRIQPYGGSYGTNRTITNTSLPSWGISLAERMYQDGFSEKRFNQMLVNEYLPGQGIAFHRDYMPYGKTIVSLSLLSGYVMDFRRAEDGKRASLLLEPRSLLIMSDHARYQWEHGIARRKTDIWKGMKLVRSRRLSVTFRFT